MSKYERIPGVFLEKETLTLMEKLFPKGEGDASFGRVARAVCQMVITGQATVPSVVVEKVMYEQLLEYATKKAEDWFNKSSNFRENNPRKKVEEVPVSEVEVTVDEPTPDCGCPHMNILCGDEELKDLKRFLSRKSDLFNSADRAILLALLKINHRYNKHSEPDEPLVYSNKRCEDDLGYRESERNHLFNLLNKHGILDRGLKRIGVLDNGDEMKITVYWLNEPALISFIKSRTGDHDEFIKEVNSLNDNSEPEINVEQVTETEDEQEELDAELVYSTKEGLVTPAQPEKLTDNEAKMLYYMHEASKLSVNKYRCGSKSFMCQFDYLSKYIKPTLIKETRESLVKKGYIKVKSVPRYQGLIYRILKFPDYLKNAS